MVMRSSGCLRLGACNICIFTLFPTIIFPDILEFSSLTFIFRVFKGVMERKELPQQSREIDMPRVLRKYFLS